MSRREFFIMLLLVTSVLSSAIAVVWLKNQSRLLFVDLQQLRAEYEMVSMEWGRLQLEVAHLGSLEDVMRASAGRLRMHAPRPEDEVVVD